MKRVNFFLPYIFVFIFFAGCSKTKLKDNKQLLTSHYSEETYQQVEDIFTNNSEYADNMTKFILHEIIPSLPADTNRTLLDIGAGPSHITQMLSKYFSSISIVEPNQKYLELYKKRGYNAYFSNFQDVVLPEKFHFVLCSHVLYHVKHSNWPVFLKKMKRSIIKGGKGMLVIGAPRGEFENFGKSLKSNLPNDYSNTSLLKKILTDLNFSFSVTPRAYTFKTSNYADFYIVIELFTITDYYELEAFNRLSISQKNEIYAKIHNFCQSCKKDNGEYELVIEDDILVFDA